MAMSNAERQRRWRQQQRETNKEAYLKKERMRKRVGYVPTKELSKDKQEERRQKCRNGFRKYYQKVKHLKAANQQPIRNQTRKVCGLRKDRLLKVKIPFVNYKNESRKREKLIFSGQDKDIQEIEEYGKQMCKSTEAEERPSVEESLN